MMRTRLQVWCGLLVCAGAAAALAQPTVTVSLDATHDGEQIVAGTIIDWTITVRASSGDNAGLSLVIGDFVQDHANPGFIDLPPGDIDSIDATMANFSRPAGVSNAGDGGAGTGYIGIQRGELGAMNLYQFGGGQNTFGIAGTGDVGQSVTVIDGVGHGRIPQTVLSGSFAAPATLGTYIFRLEDVVANTLDVVPSPPVPPAYWPVSAATVVYDKQEFSFGVRLPYPPILYVDESVDVPGDGSTWESAFLHVQQALQAARLSAGEVEKIYVARGTYKADQPYDVGSMTASFELVDGVEMYGGYPSGGGGPKTRIVAKNPTILDGNIGDPNTAIDNSYHVVTGDNLTAGTIFDGFIIKNGRAGVYGDPKSPHAYRAGMDLGDCSLKIRQCTFQDNYAALGAAAIGVEAGSPVISRCIFLDNMVGGYEQGGGGIVFGPDTVAPVVMNCCFLGNLGTKQGGGVVSWASDLTIGNSVFSGNLAYFGAGFYNGGHATLANCSFTLNAYNGVWQDNADVGSLVVHNCILWGNGDGGGGLESDQLSVGDGTPPVIHYSCVQGWTGGWGGVGNIATNPLFVDADGPDNSPGSADDDLRLYGKSPCIDAGSNAWAPLDLADLDGDGNTLELVPYDLAMKGRFYGTSIDMGAYEYRPLVKPYPYPWEFEWHVFDTDAFIHMNYDHEDYELEPNKP